MEKRVDTREIRRLPAGITRRKSDSNGDTSYQVRVRKTGYPTFTGTFTKLEEAKAWKALTETKLNNGEAVATAKSRRYTIGEAIADYLEHGGIAEKDNKRYTLAQVSEDFPNLAVRNLTVEILSKWIKKKLTSTVPKAKNKKKTHPLYEGETDRKYTESAVRKFYYALKLCLEWHSQFKKYPFNSPFNIVKAPVENNSRIRRLEEGEEERLLDACDKMYANKLALKTIIQTALETAMRAGELLNLEWQEINFETSTIYIPKEKCKTKRHREVPITSTCRALLVEYKKEHIKKDETRVFWQWPNSNVLGHRFKIIMKNAEVKNFRFHDLRHEATSRFFERSTLNDIEIAIITGHSDLRTLKRYTHLRPNSLLSRMW